MRVLETPWYADYVNYIVCGVFPPDLAPNQGKKFLADTRHYYWDEPYLYRLCIDGIHRRSVSNKEGQSILEHCHSSPYGGHTPFQKKATKVLQAGFYGPDLFKDARAFVLSCDACLRGATRCRSTTSLLWRYLMCGG